MRAQFEVLQHESGKYIFIRDTGHNTGRSVTNDAEYVVEKLYEEYGITDKTRIFYKDSIGCVDEMLHAGKVFTRFRAGHEGVELRGIG